MARGAGTVKGAMRLSGRRRPQRRDAQRLLHREVLGAGLLGRPLGVGHFQDQPGVHHIA
jgi:hypothetical protein